MKWILPILLLSSCGENEKVCVAYEIRTLPLFANGPKHHIHGGQVGWINDKVCVKWENKKEDNKPLMWPKPVY